MTIYFSDIIVFLFLSGREDLNFFTICKRYCFCCSSFVRILLYSSISFTPLSAKSFVTFIFITVSRAFKYSSLESQFSAFDSRKLHGKPRISKKTLVCEVTKSLSCFCSITAWSIVVR